MPTLSQRISTVKQIIEFVANIALIVAVTVGVFAWKHRPAKVGPSLGAIGEPTSLGKQIVLPGVDWGTHKATLVVAISSACHYCLASTPFYSAITHSTHAAPIVVVMPQRDQDAQNFLRKHDIAPRSTVSAALESIQVTATPTILLISPSGIVIKEWIGELTEMQKHEVIEYLDHTS